MCPQTFILPRLWSLICLSLPMYPGRGEPFRSQRPLLPSTHPLLGMSSSSTQRSLGWPFGLGLGAASCGPLGCHGVSWGVGGRGPARPSEPLSPSRCHGLWWWPPVPHSQGGPGCGQRDAPRRKCRACGARDWGRPWAGLRVSGCPLGHRGSCWEAPASVSVSPRSVGLHHPILASPTHHPPNFLRFSLMSPAPHRLQVGTVWINAHGLRSSLQCPRVAARRAGPPGMGARCKVPPLCMAPPPSSTLCPSPRPLDTRLSQGLYEYLRQPGTPAWIPYLSKTLDYDSFGLALPSAYQLDAQERGAVWVGSQPRGEEGGEGGGSPSEEGL